MTIHVRHTYHGLTTNHYDIEDIEEAQPQDRGGIAVLLAADCGFGSATKVEIQGIGKRVRYLSFDSSIKDAVEEDFIYLTKDG